MENTENNIKEYLYIMDYSCGMIFKIELKDDDRELDDYTLLDKYGFKESDCNWMFSTVNIDKVKLITRKI